MAWIEWSKSVDNISNNIEQNIPLSKKLEFLKVPWLPEEKSLNFFLTFKWIMLI